MDTESLKKLQTFFEKLDSTRIPAGVAAQPLFVETNVRRELAYSIGHAIHHHATIRTTRLSAWRR
jgi:hypothetical protein